MNGHFRPQIKNGQLVKRTPITSWVKASPKAAPKTTRRSALAPLSPLWTGVSVSTLAQNGLSLLGLDERLHSTTTTVKENTATRFSALVGLLVCGGLLAGGFMFSLRTHFIAYAFGRDVVKLKAKTDHVNTERQHLNAQLEQAASTQEIDRAAREFTGLAPLEFDQKKVAVRAKKIAITEKAKKPSSPQQSGRSAGD